MFVLTVFDSRQRQEMKGTKETWRRTILKEVKELGKTMEKIDLLAKDRARWKSIVLALHTT